MSDAHSHSAPKKEHISLGDLPADASQASRHLTDDELEATSGGSSTAADVHSLKKKGPT